MKLSDTRRDNLRKVVERMGGTSKVAARLGYRNPSFLSQQIGPHPSRDITEKSAREYERKLNLPAGSLDGRQTDSSLLTDIIHLVGKILREEEVNPPVERFAQLVALALVDASDHGGVPREGHLREVVRLLK